ncbi:MAG: hypothetical protein M3524_11470 [Actinomycetota bacterium]|nr:hypothetical protein [Actinomycetota bacterium]
MAAIQATGLTVGRLELCLTAADLITTWSQALCFTGAAEVRQRVRLIEAPKRPHARSPPRPGPTMTASG